MIVSAERLTTVVSLPVKYFSNIGFNSCVKPNSLLIAFSVPSYWAKPVLIIPLVKSMLSLVSSTNAIAFMNAVTLTAIPALGLKYKVLSVPFILVPNVPRPVLDSTLPYSTIYVWPAPSLSASSSHIKSSDITYLLFVESVTWRTKYAASKEELYWPIVVIPGLPEDAIFVVLASIRACFKDAVPIPCAWLLCIPTWIVLIVTPIPLFLGMKSTFIFVPSRRA